MEKGGGGDGKILVVISVPDIRPINYIGEGEHKVLLVLNKTVTLTESHPIGKIAKFAAPKIVSDICRIDCTKVERALAESLESQERKMIRNGRGDYIDELVLVLNQLFSEEEIKFSSELVK